MTWRADPDVFARFHVVCSVLVHDADSVEAIVDVFFSMVRVTYGVLWFVTGKRKQ